MAKVGWKMNLNYGIHHKRTLEDVIIIGLQVAIVFLIVTIGAMFAVDAWIKEDINRVAKLKEHIYGVTEQRSYAVPNPHDLASPKTRVFAEGGGK